MSQRATVRSPLAKNDPVLFHSPRFEVATLQIWSLNNDAYVLYLCRSLFHRFWLWWLFKRAAQTAAATGNVCTLLNLPLTCWGVLFHHIYLFVKNNTDVKLNFQCWKYLQEQTKKYYSLDKWWWLDCFLFAFHNVIRSIMLHFEMQLWLKCSSINS